MNRKFNNAVLTSVWVLVLLGIVLFVDSVEAKQLESYYRDIDCKYEHGIPEYRNSDGTWTDCFTGNLSIEHDFAPKWYECVTQAMYYADLNRNFAVCKLIVITDNDKKLANKAKAFVKRHKLPVIVETILGE